MLRRIPVARLLGRSGFSMRFLSNATKGSSQEETMKKFLRVCTNVEEMDVSSLEQLNFPRSNETDRLLVANLCTSIIPDICPENDRCEWPETSDTILQALILPNDMMWPTFLHEEYSQYADGKHILFRRVALHSLKRELQTEQSLVNDKSVVYVGVPGIGKTHSLNYVLLRCLHSWAPNGLSELKFEKFPFSRVIFRLTNGFYVISNTTKPGDELLSTDVKYVETYDLSAINKECSDHAYTRENTLLLLELTDDDENHVNSLPICYLASNSCRRADRVFAKKKHNFYLMDPWSYAECVAMGRVLDAAAGRRADDDTSIERNVNEMFAYSEGVPSRLTRFADPGRLRRDLEENAWKFFEAKGTISAYNVPTIWTNYVAPFVRNYDKYDLNICEDNYEMKYLSNATRHMIFSLALSNQK